MREAAIVMINHMMKRNTLAIMITIEITEIIIITIIQISHFLSIKMVRM